MAKQGTATPKLRFPEFRESGDWRHAPLGKLFSERQEAGFIDLPLLSLMDKEGIVLQEESNRKNNSNADKSKYLRVVPGDIAYNTMRMWEGRSAYVGIEGLISPAYTVCVPIDGINGRFFSYYFKTSQLVGEFRKYSQGLVKDTLNLKYENFQRIDIAYPIDKKEQQKIADCLTSLDEVIAAQGRKVEALKAHKRGLMQQLFPREGETRPRLRFPDFRNAAEWRNTKLKSLGELVSGLTYSPDDVRDSGLLVLRSSNVQNTEIALDDNVYVTPSIKGANLAKPNDILICVRNGSKALIGKSALIPDGMPLCTHGAFMTMFRARAPQFVFQLMQSSSFQKQVAADLGATINSINGSQLLKYRFFVPEPDEQERIAELLSSLSHWIAEEAKKLTGLKTHKRGLMQQLFPSPEGS